jgi:V-type H+-transporting ATPase subunit E
MVAFIESEAKEKAQEIRVRAEEEFQVQRQSFVQAEKAKITKEYERKEKAEEVQRKM